MLPFLVFVIPWLFFCLLAMVYRSIKKTIYNTHGDLKGKVVVITGASSGLGRECAFMFARAGSWLILCSRNEKELMKVKLHIVEELRKSGEKVENEPVVIKMDLGLLETMADVGKEILNVYGYVDILVNNAGISYRGSICDTSLETHQTLMNVNYFGTVGLTQALIPSLIERKKGHIVVVSSVQGKVAIPFRSAYAASKHACQAFFDCARAELAEHGIKVTTISPGYIKTNLSANALTSDGSRYGVTDETTLSGMPPSVVAYRIREAIEAFDEDVIIADLKGTAAVYLRYFLPELFSLLMKKRAKSYCKKKEKDS